MIKHSEEQLDIFDFVKYGHGNAVVSAVAGSGKTTTIVEALNYIKPDKRVLFLAFNNSIVDELKKRITRNKTDIKTLHSLGFSIIKFNFKDIEINIDENKYKNKLNEILTEKCMERLPNKSYVKNILKLLDLGRLNFCNSKKELLNIANRHSIVTSFKIDDEFNEINIVNELIVWSKNSLNEYQRKAFNSIANKSWEPDEANYSIASKWLEAIKNNNVKKKQKTIFPKRQEKKGS